MTELTAVARTVAAVVAHELMVLEGHAVDCVRRNSWSCRFSCFVVGVVIEQCYSYWED